MYRVPSAFSRDLSGVSEREMRFIRASKIRTDPLSQFAGRQQASWFNHSALAMDPLGLDGVQPGTLLGQQEGKNAYACTRLLDLLVVLSDPCAHHLAHVPGGMIPDQEPVVLALFGQALTAPVQKLDRDGRDRTTGEKAQPHLLAHGPLVTALLPQDAITARALGSGSSFCHDCSTRWKGCSWLCQADMRGKAKRLHQT